LGEGEAGLAARGSFHWPSQMFLTLASSAAPKFQGQGGLGESSARLSAFGARRTCGGSGGRIARSQLTHSGHKPGLNSAEQQSPGVTLTCYPWNGHGNAIQSISGLAQRLSGLPAAA